MYEEDYKIAKYFAKNGLVIGSSQGIIKNTSTYIYDNDPFHHESYKKGDIRVFRFYTKNSFDSKTYEFHDFATYLKWMINKKSLYVQLNISKDIKSNIYWTFGLYNVKTAECLKIINKRYFSYDNVIKAALNYIVKNKILEKYNL